MSPNLWQNVKCVRGVNIKHLLQRACNNLYVSQMQFGKRLEWILSWHLLNEKGFDVILVVDKLSYYEHFSLLKHPYSAKGISEIFVRE